MDGKDNIDLRHCSLHNNGSPENYSVLRSRLGFMQKICFFLYLCGTTSVPGVFKHQNLTVVVRNSVEIFTDLT